MKTTTDTPYMASSYVRALFDFAVDHQLPLAQLLDVFGLTIPQLDEGDLLLDPAALSPAFAVLERLSGDSNIGLHIGQRMRPSHLGVMGLLLMTCTDSRQLFELHTRYGRLISNATSPEYATWQESVCLQLNERNGDCNLSRHRIEYSLAGWMQLGRWLLGEEFSATRIEFAHPQPSDISEQSAFFGCPLTFDNPATRVFFPVRFYDSHVTFTIDKALHDSLEREARKRLAKIQGQIRSNDKLLEQLRQYISEQLPYGVPEIGRFSESAGMSIRSIQRRLEVIGTKYKTEIERVRQELCYRHLDNADLSLVDIAFMLGFSDQSAFHKAFRRWHGCSPGEFRRQLNQPAEENFCLTSKKR
jgi:AraC-like DNA-binding protein